MFCFLCFILEVEMLFDYLKYTRSWERAVSQFKLIHALWTAFDCKTYIDLNVWTKYWPDQLNVTSLYLFKYLSDRLESSCWAVPGMRVEKCT